MLHPGFHYTEVIDPNYWAIQLDGMKIDDDFYQLPTNHTTALIDSGSSLLHMPTPYYQATMTKLNKSELSCEPRYGFIFCRCETLDVFPVLNFKINNKFFAIEP